MAEYRVGPGVYADQMNNATNWREIYRRNPWIFVAAALAGGVLIAVAANGYRRRGSYGTQRLTTAARTAAGAAASAGAATTELWDRVKGALVAGAAAQLRRLLHDVVPSVIEDAKQAAQSTPSMTASRSFASRAANGVSAEEASAG